MTIHYILIDFENIQPSAAELGLIRGPDCHVRLFHGPHQNKFDADVVKALQPLGAQVEYVQCDRKGKNALDFRIAFVLGRLVHEREAAVSPLRKQARFIVVSNDAGFDELLDHLRTMGYDATRAASIREALGIKEPTDQPTAPSAIATPAPLPPSANGATAVAAKASPKPDSARPPTAATETPAPTTANPVKKAAKSSAKPANAVAADPWTKAIANLRDHPENRPTTRAALERHLKTLLGNGSTDAKAKALAAQLEREGVATVAAGKIEYRLPKKTKPPS
jgi:hypothetical protein